MTLEFVVTSEDPKLTKGLMVALERSDELATAYASRSVFERVYFTPTEAVAVIKEGCNTEARHRLEKALQSKIPYAKETGLKMFIREVNNGKKDNPLPSQ